LDATLPHTCLDTSTCYQYIEYSSVSHIFKFIDSYPTYVLSPNIRHINQAIFFLPSQMAQMNTSLNSAFPDILVPGSSYRIVNAKRITTEKGICLLVWLLSTPHILCKFPGNLACILSDYEIEQINNNKLFVSFSFFGKHDLVNPFFK